MKIKVYLIIICASYFMSSMNYAQTLTQEEKERVLLNLSNPPDSLYTENSQSDAIRDVKQFKIIEAIPIILQNIWKQEPWERRDYLHALFFLNAPQTHECALAFIDSMATYQFTDNLIRKDLYPNHELDRLEYMANAAEILIRQGDYSRRQIIYDYVNAKHPEFFEGEVSILSNILKYYSKDEELARNELIRITKHNGNDSERMMALLKLFEIYGDEILQLAIEQFSNDSSPLCRFYALIDVLQNYKSKNISSILQSHVLIEPDLVLKRTIVDILMTKYGTPQDYILFQQVYSSFPDSFFSDIYSREYFLKEYNPIFVDSTESVFQIIDSLKSIQTQCIDLNWLGDANFSLQLNTLLTEASGKLNSGDSLGTAIKIKQYQSLINEEYKDSLDNDGKFVTSDGYKFLYYYPKYILERLPKLPAVKLEDSHGSFLPGGSLQYYEGGWKDAINNNDGTFNIGTKLKTVSLRMTYEYGSQTKSNVSLSADTVLFQTVNAVVKLQNSNGNVIDTGKVQYYAGGWRNFGQTINGMASKELLAANYTFRVSYAFASNDKAQDLSQNPAVVFQTVNTNVELKNSLGNLMDQGTVQYYSGGWREFGSISNGVVAKELLPNNYTFRMSYEFASNDKAQNTGINPTVVFQTVNTNVELRNSLGNLIDVGTVQYYSGGWREFGATSNGIVSKELLPNNYTFRMTYGFASIDKAQNIGTNSTVTFPTVLCTIRVKDLQNQPVNNARVSYYSGGWRAIGNTVNGEIAKEFLPVNLTFRINSGTVQLDKTQNLSTNNLVEFTIGQ